MRCQMPLNLLFIACVRPSGWLLQSILYLLLATLRDLSTVQLTSTFDTANLLKQFRIKRGHFGLKAGVIWYFCPQNLCYAHTLILDCHAGATGIKWILAPSLFSGRRRRLDSDAERCRQALATLTKVNGQQDRQFRRRPITCYTGMERKRQAAPVHSQPDEASTAHSTASSPTSSQPAAVPARQAKYSLDTP